MFRQFVVLIPLLVTLHAAAAQAATQGTPAPQTGTIVVTVADTTGGHLIGASCVLTPSNEPRVAVVDAEGHCTFSNVAPGAYRVAVTLAGFKSESRTAEVTPGRAATLAVVLTPANLAETVVVSAVRVPTPVTALPHTVTILDQSVLEQRTDVSDDLASVLEANVPGFGPSLKKLTGRGESLRGRNPLYTINGVPQHTPLRDGERDGHTIDLDFVDRIEVVHGSNAIQGIGATGGVVNLVTKSPRSDGAWTHDVKLSTGNADSFEGDGWSSKISYLLGKRVGRVEWVAGAAIHRRGLFYDASGRAIGLYPTQGDIMDSTARGFYGKVGVDLTANRRLDISVNDFTLKRDGDFVPIPGNRAIGLLTTSVPGDARAVVGDPAKNDSITLSVDYRDRSLWGGELALQAYGQNYEALFEGGAFTTFALTVGGPAFLDQSAITSDKRGLKTTWSASRALFAGVTPMFGIDVSTDSSEQRLARTDRTWVPETTLREFAPFVQLQRTIKSKLLLSGGVRVSAAALQVDDFTTLPSARSTLVGGGSPSYTEVLPNVGAVVFASQRLSFYGSFSEGFTMPDVGRVLRGVSTPGLSVETLVDVEPVVTGNVEFGADYRMAGAHLHASYYRSTSDRGSLLERTADSQVFAVRREKTNIDGLDFTANVPVARAWSTGATVSWLRGRFDSDGDGSVDTDLDGLNLSPGRINVFVEGQPASWLTTRLQVSTLRDRRVRGLSPPRRGAEFEGYTLADLALGFPLKLGTVRLGIENLLDKHYVLYFSQVDTGGANDTFFAGQGRSFVLSFERRF
jgi:iron complex outermembrane receptor protein